LSIFDPPRTSQDFSHQEHNPSLLTAGASQPSSLSSHCHRRLDTRWPRSEGGCCLSLTHHAPHKTSHSRSPNFPSLLTIGTQLPNSFLSRSTQPIVLSPFHHCHSDIYWPRSEGGRWTTRLFNFIPPCIVLRPELSCQDLTLYDAYDIF